MPTPLPALPSLNTLRVFDAVAQHGNFRLAAEALGVTQAAVAQQVRGLEAHLGIRLFDRLARGVALTTAGHGYSTSVREALSLIEAATQRLYPDAGRITVSVTPSFASRWLIPRLGLFAERHPRIDLNVLASDRLAQFQADRVDLAVRHGRPPFGAGLNAQLLFEPRVIAVASPRLLNEHGVLTAPWAGEVAILHDAHDLWPTLLAAVGPGIVRPTARHVRFNQTSLAIEAALDGQGIALVDRAFIVRDLANGRLVQVLDHVVRPDAAFYAVWPRKAGQSSVLPAVIDWLRQQAADS
ncbi:LysR family transcriptional regulator [Pseudomonas entomophila]|jgi:LysR family glycine cleavage system transcriptional activator|uniref:LysR substrate-binding domain-containing protein n=1 Tax=Pseudomonas entomophila TaxID=312306 RepID=UPI0015E47D8F|nr:LysR substrate-binding domain-containing protein [Pseudomonas entomophila]MBA1193185.1 LysR family transcriptional regulator [Pseudomonas entomophila]